MYSRRVYHFAEYVFTPDEFSEETEKLILKRSENFFKKSLLEHMRPCTFRLSMEDRLKLVVLFQDLEINKITEGHFIPYVFICYNFFKLLGLYTDRCKLPTGEKLVHYSEMYERISRKIRNIG